DTRSSSLVGRARTGGHARLSVAEWVRSIAINAVVDWVVAQPEWAVEPGVRFSTDEQAPLEQLPDDEFAAGLAESEQPVVIALELRVHVGDGVDAIAPAAVRSLADRVDALIADPAALHELLLEQEPAVKTGANLVWSPHGDMLAEAERHANGFVQLQVSPRL